MNARPSPALSAFALLLAAAAPKASACELDGLSHGYGPMGAIFAGAHRYQSLNGLADEAEERAGIAPPVEAIAKAQPPTPRRSFASWATRKTASAAADEAPARWTAPPPASGSPPAGAPGQATTVPVETGQR